MNREDLKALEQRVHDASKALETAVAKSWPVGAKVNFMLMHGQKNPSFGEVRFHTHDGYVGVRMDTVDAYRSERRTIKRIHPSNMVTEPRS